MKKLIIIALASTFMLSGCFWNTKTEYITKIVEVPVNNIVYARPMRPSLLNIEWKVYGEKNRGDAVIYLQDKALMCLSIPHYENLGKNMTRIYSTEEGLYSLLDKYEADRATDEAKEATKEE